MALLQEILVPLLAVNDTTLTVVEIALSTGAKINKGDLLIVFESSKTTYDVEAEISGYIQYLCEQDKDYAVNEVVARIYSEEAEILITPAATPLFSAASVSTPSEPLPFWEGETLFSREATRLIESHGLDKSIFGGKDFVSGADVMSVLHPTPLTPSVRPASPSADRTPRIDPQKVIVEKLSRAKRREIEYLSDIQSAGLTSTLHSYVDTAGIFTHINRSQKYLKDSLLPVILYEVSRLLAGYPLLNGYFTEQGIALYKDINVGFAIDIDKGLKVLKIPRSAEKSVSELETAIIELSGRYLDDALQIDDLEGVTFTVTDLSAEGIVFFQPLINKMNSAILGVSAIDPQLHRCMLSLTFDHRVTEGKLAARMLHDLKERLESYRLDQTTFQNINCFKCYKSLSEDLGEVGFARCITPEGKDGYICQTCFNGY
jgi:pyruvate/2-oxoglutarate dehydrogenase complex dihydrolipoamide acyltransferase (E2) component